MAVFGRDRALPRPYKNRERGQGSALSLPRLIVGKRHCRLLTVGNLNSDATGFDISCGKTCGQITLILWKTLISRCKKFLTIESWAIDYTKFSTSFPQA